MGVLDPTKGIYKGDVYEIGKPPAAFNSAVRAMDAKGLRQLADQLEAALTDTEDAVVAAYERRNTRAAVREQIREEIRLSTTTIPRA